MKGPKRIFAFFLALMMVAQVGTTAFAQIPNEAQSSAASQSILLLGSGTTFYVAADGNDSNDGLTEATAWQTVARAAQEMLSPGDSILFRRGDVFNGQFVAQGPSTFPGWESAVVATQNSGTAIDPITLGSFGNASLPKPIIHGGGVDGGTIEIRDLSHWTVQDLAITNTPANGVPGNYSGILVVTPWSGTDDPVDYWVKSIDGIQILNNEIFNVAGSNAQNAGIFFNLGQLPNYNNFVVSGNTVQNVSNRGIYFVDNFTTTWVENALQNAVITNNTVINSGSYGIVVTNADAPTISGNRWWGVGAGTGLELSNVINETISDNSVLPADPNQTFTITYFANQGDGTPIEITVNPGDNHTVQANTFTRTDHDFVEWNTSADGTGTAYSPGDVITDVRQNITLFAQWSRTGGARIFFVAANGDDSNDGLTEATAWRTIARANQQMLEPGDQLLFRRGDEFHGNFIAQGPPRDSRTPSTIVQTQNNGTAANPITIGAFGPTSLPRPILHGGGNATGSQSPGTIELLDISHWIVRDLAITNNDGTGLLGLFTGITVMAPWSGTTDGSQYFLRSVDGIQIINNEIFDIAGAPGASGHLNGGIYFELRSIPNFRNFVVEGNIIRNVGNVGINFNNPWANEWLEFVLQDGIIRNNTVMNTGSDGIVIRNADSPTITGNRWKNIGAVEGESEGLIFRENVRNATASDNSQLPFDANEAYTITYFPNRGVGAAVVHTALRYTNHIIAANTFTRENWTFLNWNTEANGRGQAFNPGEQLTSLRRDVVLFAQWERNDPDEDTIGDDRIGIIYYVDSVNGNDNNDGLTEATAWRTIQRANETMYEPGDQILFRRGQEFHGRFIAHGRTSLRVTHGIPYTQNSGSRNNPITLGAFGDPSLPKPIIHGPGIGSTSSNKPYGVIELHDISHWVVRDLAITNRTPVQSHFTVNGQLFDEAFIAGISIRDDWSDGEVDTLMNGLQVINNDIYDIYGFSVGIGTNEDGSFGRDWFTGAIYVEIAQTQRMTGLVIEDNYIYDVRPIAIRFMSTHSPWLQYPIKEPRIVGNTIRNNGRDGVIIQNAENVYAAHNRLYDIGKNTWKDPGFIAGLWLIECYGGLFEHNSVIGMRPTGDSFAYNVDVRNHGTIIWQYNYSERNRGFYQGWFYEPGGYFGGFFMMTPNTMNAPGDKVIVRYNVSVGERGGMRLANGGAYVYNNLFIDENEPMYISTAVNLIGGDPTVNGNRSILFNNIFYSGNMEDAPLFAVDTGLIFMNNLYVGKPGTAPVTDTLAIEADPMFSNIGDTLRRYIPRVGSPVINQGMTAMDVWDVIYNANISPELTQRAINSVNLHLADTAAFTPSADFFGTALTYATGNFNIGIAEIVHDNRIIINDNNQGGGGTGTQDDVTTGGTGGRPTSTVTTPTPPGQVRPGLPIPDTAQVVEVNNPTDPTAMDEAIENALQNLGSDKESVAIILPDGNAALAPETLVRLNSEGINLVLAHNVAIVEIPYNVLGNLAMTEEMISFIFTVNLHEDQEALATVIFRAFIGGVELATLSNDVTIVVDLGENLNLNPYRIIAVFEDGTIVGGTLNEDGLFTFSTSRTGEFIIRYIASLIHLRVSLNSHTIYCLAGNAPTQFMDVLPHIVTDIYGGSRAVLPLRAVAEALGATVYWHGETQEVSITLGQRQLTFAIGDDLGGVAAFIKDNRTMVPARFISEFFGALVIWSQETQSFDIIL